MPKQTDTGEQMHVGQRIRALREATGLSIERTAAAVGVSQGALWHIETGRAKPRLSTLQGLARHFGVTLDELAGDA